MRDEDERVRRAGDREPPAASRGALEGSPEQRVRAWERLVLDISANFVRLDAESLDVAIEDAIAELGPFAGADRCYVFRHDRDAQTMSNTHEWCAAGVEPQRDHLQRIPTSIWPFWMASIRRHEIINWRVADLPEEASAEKEALAAQGVRAVIALPMVDRVDLLGFVGFDSVRRDRIWSTEEVKLLRLSADLLANALVRIRHEEELRRAREHLAQAAKMEALGRLVGGTAHDFNNLLTIIRGNCDLADVEDDLASMKERIGEIRVATDRAAALTRSLLSFGRRQKSSPRRLESNRLVQSAEAFVGRLLGSRVTLECELDPEAGDLFVDESQFQQQLLNLAANARDAMADGGKLVLRTRRIEADEYGDERVLIEVADDGEGMDRQTLERAFDPFFSTKPEHSGTGLGLSSVHGFATQHGGTVALESVEGRGTTVRMVLPVYRPSDVSEPVADEASEHPSS